MLKKIRLFFTLARLNSPTGFLLAFFPSAYGIVLSKNICNFEELLVYLCLFLLGSIAARSAGCIINDICDAKFDAQVARTKLRPIASNLISNKEAVLFLCICFAVAILILLSLNNLAIYIGIVCAVLTALYPLSKRFMKMPQIFLGLVFNLGVFIGYVSVSGGINCSAIILYISCFFWTFGYDTIYAFADLIDDQKLNIGSSAKFLYKKNYKLYILSSYALFLVLFLVAFDRAMIAVNIYFALAAFALLVFQVYKIDLNQKPEYFIKIFKLNNYVGFGLLLSIL